MSTERERYDEWRDKQDGSFKAFDVWNAAVKNEREQVRQERESRERAEQERDDAVKAHDVINAEAAFSMFGLAIGIGIGLLLGGLVYQERQ